eukprot:CAMPEP_0197562860 /NCGR_PEP_ID=MMETSP1320-20131121/27653_1 /TAXON_ID=91990 /ORGANISM="Bolidomonas sp., Strain RCC2347" /LENGTH=324 /DNA_ID=CAMNT_0043124621 /DNA_START=120 /DNA_END=1090 /DNA_ORIENTATION=+
MAYRIGTKFLSDFSGAPMFADPSDMGKAWLPSMLLIFGLNWYLFLAAKSALSDVSEKEMFRLMVVTTAGYISAWFILLTKGAKSGSLMSNFVAQNSGKEMYSEAWISVDDHRKMAMIVEVHPAQFRGIAANIKDWIGDNWEQWREEETFNAEVLACIPDEFIPEELIEEVDADFSDRFSTVASVGVGSPSILRSASRRSGGRLTSSIMRGKSGIFTGNLGRTPAQQSRGLKLAEELKERHDEHLRKWSLEKETKGTRLDELNRGRRAGVGLRRASNFAANAGAGGAGRRNSSPQGRRASLEKLRRDSGVQSRLEERRAQERRMS